MARTSFPTAWRRSTRSSSRMSGVGEGVQSAATAFAWELRQRHRWGTLAVLVSFVALAVIRLVVAGTGRVVFDSAETFAIALVVPMCVTFIYFLAVFSFGLAGDIAARQSIFPARMFTLPVTS